MGRRSWYADHPRSCTCYWCNEGRRREGGRRRGWFPFRRERPETPLPDWMLEGIEPPPASTARGGGGPGRTLVIAAAVIAIIALGLALASGALG